MMLQIPFIELLMKGIPEGILSVFALFIFTKSKVVPKLFIQTTLTVIIATYFIRFLPINLGVNTILSLFVFIVLAYKFLNVALIKSIITSLCVVVLISLCEALSGVFYLILYGQPFIEKLKILGKLKDASGATRNITNAALFNEQLQKSIYSIPSTILLIIFVVIIYFVFKAVAKKSKVKNGETNSEISK